MHRSNFVPILYRRFGIVAFFALLAEHKFNNLRVINTPGRTDSVPGHHHPKGLRRFHRFSPAHDSADDNSLDGLREQMSLVLEQHFQEFPLGLKLRIPGRTARRAASSSSVGHFPILSFCQDFKFAEPKIL